MTTTTKTTALPLKACSRARVMGKWQRYGLRFHRESWKDAGKGRVTDKKRSPFGRVCPPEKEGLVVQQQQPLFANGILFCFFACFFVIVHIFGLRRSVCLRDAKLFYARAGSSGENSRTSPAIPAIHGGLFGWLIVLSLFGRFVFLRFPLPPSTHTLHNPVGIWSLPQQPFAQFVACSRTPTARARE